MNTPATFYEQLKKIEANHSKKQALIKGDRVLTYENFLSLINKVAEKLIALGLQKGEKVVLWASPDPMWLCASFGIIRAGGIVIMLNSNLTVENAKPLIDFADGNFLIYGHTHDTKGSSDEVSFLSDALDIKTSNICSLFDIEKEETESVSEDEYSARYIGPTEDAIIMYTSGTTAFPKAVCLSQRSVIDGCAGLADGFKSIQGERGVIAAPLFHIYGVVTSWFYLGKGYTVLIPDRIKAEVIADFIVKEKATDLCTVAIIYQRIVDKPELAAKISPNIGLCTIAGSYTTPTQFMKYEKALNNATFINMFGLTEAIGFCMTRPEDDIEIRYNSLGRPVHGAEITIWDKRDGELPRGSVGEILTRGTHLMNGYYKLPQESQIIDADGWLHTGDLGMIDDGGNLRIVGRIKDVIIKGGESISPAAIETKMMEIDCIKECKIFGYKDRTYGENLGACYTLNEGQGFDEEYVKKFLNRKVGSYQTPDYYFEFDEFPINANGKIDQEKLRQNMLERKKAMECQ